MRKYLPENERKAVRYLRLAAEHIKKAQGLTEHDNARFNMDHAFSDICDIMFTILNTEY